MKQIENFKNGHYVHINDSFLFYKEERAITTMRYSEEGIFFQSTEQVGKDFVSDYYLLFENKELAKAFCDKFDLGYWYIKPAETFPFKEWEAEQK